MASRKPPPTPFHVELRKLREGKFMLPATIAGRAGVTIAVYNAMELGHAPVSRAVYDAAVKTFPVLKSYPRPGVDPCVQTPKVHPAVDMEHRRTQSFHDACLKLNIGTTNRNVVRTLLLLVLAGHVTFEDINRYFP